MEFCLGCIKINRKQFNLWKCAVFILNVLVLTSCGHSQTNGPMIPGELSPTDSQDLWDRCRIYVLESMCHPDIVQDRRSCILRIMNDFYEQDTFEIRQKKMLYYGCPINVVSP
jgi:hypothetical protein